jgi:hypothetical protein
MNQETEPDYARGDLVGWHTTTRHGAGSGIVVEVERHGTEIRYMVQKLIDGKPVGPTFPVDQGVVFPIRSLTDTRPQPAPHRRDFP